MTNPQEFRLVLMTSYLVLAMLGIGYNKLIDYAERWDRAKGVTSFSVVIGVSFTLIVLWLFFLAFRLPSIPLSAFMVLMFGGFACSGSPMMIGQRMRYARNAKEEEEAIKGHRPQKWPHNMKAMRDAAAEEAVGGLRVLKGIGPLPAEQDAKVLRVRGSLLKIAALLSRAGANIRLEDL